MIALVVAFVSIYKESRGWLTGYQGVKGLADGFQGGQRVGLKGPRGSRGRPKGYQGVQGKAYRALRGQGGGERCPIGSTATFDGSSDDM